MEERWKIAPTVGLAGLQQQPAATSSQRPAANRAGGASNHKAGSQTTAAPESSPRGRRNVHRLGRRDDMVVRRWRGWGRSRSAAAIGRQQARQALRLRAGQRYENLFCTERNAKGEKGDSCSAANARTRLLTFAQDMHSDIANGPEGSGQSRLTTVEKNGRAATGGGVLGVGGAQTGTQKWYDSDAAPGGTRWRH